MKPPPDGAGAVEVLPKLKPVAGAGAVFVDGAPKLKAMVGISVLVMRVLRCVGWFYKYISNPTKKQGSSLESSVRVVTRS